MTRASRKVKKTPAERRQIRAMVFGGFAGVLILLLLSDPVSFSLGLQPSRESFATGKARVTKCETGFWQLWVIEHCDAQVTWSDGNQEYRTVKSTQVRVGEVDVVERRVWIKPRRTKGHYSYVVVPADQRVDTNRWWNLPLALGGMGFIVGLGWLGHRLARPRPTADKPAPDKVEWKSKISTPRERRQRFNGPKSRR